VRFQTTKAQNIDIRKVIPLPVLNHKQSMLIKNTTHGNLSSLLLGFFKIFTHEKDNVAIGNIISGNNTVERDNESRSLKHLEDTANAARETEGYGQYEWINKSDE
jgi:hypothetical protein